MRCAPSRCIRINHPYQFGSGKPPLHIGVFIARNARRRPAHPALVWRGKRHSWSQLNARVNRFANVLQRLGAGPGVAIASLVDNCNELLELNFAAAKIGAVFVPIMPRSVGREISHVVNDVGAKILVVHHEFSPAVAPVIGELRTIEAVIRIGSGDAQDLERLLRDASPEEPDARFDPDQVSLIKYTSGTSGAPKGCARTHRQTAIAALLYAAQVPHYESDRATISSPMAAGFALSLANCMVLAGTTIHLLPRFDALQLLETIERERITLAYAIQSTFNALTRHPELDRFDLSSVRLFTGTSATQDTILGLQRLREHPRFGGRFFNAYGSTEAGGYIAYNLPEDYEEALARPELAQRVESIGREGYACRVECLGEDMRSLPSGEVGEMAIQAPTVFSGYWNMPEATAAVFRDGWLMTGDLALKDEDGFLYLAGRKRDMIKTGGINVYPAEVEYVLAGHPKVAEVAVVGLTDEQWGEKVVACVVPRQTCTAQDLLEYCAGRLAGHKRPKGIHFMDDLPKNDTGKIVKQELRELVQARERVEIRSPSRRKP
jgi:acyl-CoA synthetase (AMP-forming)/AMP-acid ligase II